MDHLLMLMKKDDPADKTQKMLMLCIEGLGSISGNLQKVIGKDDKLMNLDEKLKAALKMMKH